ncbi:hypothetical protein HY345_04640 [Candidatus Microgenomates bacterium]|nr:hypothetical protein [Candidatus Microgenomates bacterium]
MEKKVKNEKIRHQLYTPLTSIRGYIQLLQTTIRKNSREEKWLKELDKESKRLTKMIMEVFRS